MSLLSHRSTGWILSVDVGTTVYSWYRTWGVKPFTLKICRPTVTSADLQNDMNVRPTQNALMRTPRPFTNSFIYSHQVYKIQICPESYTLIIPTFQICTLLSSLISLIHGLRIKWKSMSCQCLVHNFHPLWKNQTRKKNPLIIDIPNKLWISLIVMSIIELWMTSDVHD